MSVLTQGTQIYFIDPADGSVVEIGCPTAFNPGGNPADQLEDTCLSATNATYKPGLRRPGAATITLNADPNDPSHVRLFELSNDNGQTDIKFVVGWSDDPGTDPTAATDSDGEHTFSLPTSRTWYSFEGYVSDFPFDFALNSLVASTVTVQRSGAAVWTPAGS